MSQFVTPLQVEWIGTDDDGVPSWKLLDELVYDSNQLGRTVRVPAGFVTDFASVPRAPVVYFLAGGTGNRAAVVHDYLVHSKEVPRTTADDVFYEALLVTGVHPVRAYAMYKAVQSYTTALNDPWTPYDPGSANA